MRHQRAPTWVHDCDKCRYLGHTLGNQRLFDLYVCDPVPDRTPTLVARYGDEGGNYLSCPATYASPTGHAELFVAAYLWMHETRDEE